MTANAIATEPVAVPKQIKVGNHAIRLRFVQQAIWSFAAATAGAYVISALYYLITQVDWTVSGHTVLYLKPQWDSLVSATWWDQGRHYIRDVYEGALATIGVKSLMANWKKNPLERVSDVRVITGPLVLFAIATPFIVGMSYLLAAQLPKARWLQDNGVMRHLASWAATWPSWLGTFLSTWNWQPLVIGILTGLVVHRYWRPIGNTIQLFFIDMAVTRARKQHQLPGWVLLPMVAPPVVRERIAWMFRTGEHAEKHGRWVRIILPAAAVILIALVLYGAFIRLWFAKHGTCTGCLV